MKNIQIFIAVGLVTLLTACGGTNTTAETQSTIDGQTNRGRSSAQVAATGTASGRVSNATAENTERTASTTTRTTTAVNNRSAMAANKEKMEKMYTHLNMTEGQISRYESEWRKATGSWNGSNGQEMNAYERAEVQDKIMKEILDDSQFQKYQQWARENAETND